MAVQKKKQTQKKPQYVKGKKQSGAGSSVLTRRLISVGLFIVLLCGMIFGLWKGFEWINYKLYAGNSRFEIQHLVISSNGKLTEDRIREYTGLREGTNLFAVAFDDLERNFSKVPVVESVYLERKLPHTLVVEVKERVPVARISAEKFRRYPYVVDRFGFVLPPRKSSASLPLIKGLDSTLELGLLAEHPDVETTLKIIALCNSDGYLRDYVYIESLNVKYSDYIDMRLKNGIRVKMSRFSLRPKLVKLASVIKISTGQGKRLKTVDLTLDSAKAPVTYY